MVISTGITLPRMDSVWALYALQKSMMFTPWGPSAVPTGGAGVAAPACSWTLTSAAIFFLGGIALCVLRVVRRGHREPDRPCHLGVACCPMRLGNLAIVVAGAPERKSTQPRPSVVLVETTGRDLGRCAEHRHRA